jgi:hypothetical protein
LRSERTREMPNLMPNDVKQAGIKSITTTDIDELRNWFRLARVSTVSQCQPRRALRIVFGMWFCGRPTIEVVALPCCADWRRSR